MALVLDAAAHSPSERFDLVHSVIAESGARRRVMLHVPAEAVDLRAEAWQVGATSVLRTSGTGLTLIRTNRDARFDAPDLIAVALSTGPSIYTACGETQQLASSGLVIVDFRTPYAFAHAGRSGSSFTTHIASSDLGLAVEVIRAAIPRVTASPLLPMVRSYLAQMSRTMDELSDNSAVSSHVGAVTTDLIRALVLSAAGKWGAFHVPRDVLRTQIVAYLNAHLRERDLTATRVAAAHHISRRTLYNLWSDDDVTLAEWIQRQRLERVRRELSLLGAGANIAAVARSWGFVDPAHFGRRFRSRYGVSATQWLRGGIEASASTADESPLITAAGSPLPDRH